MPAGDILTKRDVAELLQVSERTVERWMSEGSIPYVPLPKRGAWSGSPLPSIRNRRVDAKAHRQAGSCASWCGECPKRVGSYPKAFTSMSQAR